MNTTTMRTPQPRRAAAAGLTLSAAALALPTASAEDWAERTTFEFGVFSDYLDTGESVSKNNAVAQGGIEYGHPGGPFLGTAVSTLDGNEQGQEVVPYLGYGFTAGEVDLSLAYEYAYYPEQDDADEGEVILGAGWRGLGAELAYMANADDSDAAGSIVYALGYGFDVAEDIALDATIGYDDPDDASGDAFWELGVSRAVDVGEISLVYGSRDESGAQDVFVAGYSVSF
ncbi:TorF family putative porin [Halorhodospira halophila]|nr:TorF family putative porin [Halorhodospira halophila]